MLVPKLSLVGGTKIPIIGYGTGGRSGSDELEKSLETALKNGYRHIDTAYLYGNEDIIGNVLYRWMSSEKVTREELFVVTKLPLFANSAEEVEECLKESLKKLQLNYVDLYLIHFPVRLVPKDPKVRFGEVIAQPTDHRSLWKKMEEQVDAGRTKTIGLSNFNAFQIAKILQFARIKPACLQIEIHVYLQNDALVKFAQENGIVVVAYTPLGRPGHTTYTTTSGIPALSENPIVVSIAFKHKKTTAQILLKFLLQRNVAVIPKSLNPNRIKQNIELFDFTLDSDDLQALRSLDLGEKSRIGFTSATFDNARHHAEWPFRKDESYLVEHI